MVLWLVFFVAALLANEVEICHRTSKHDAGRSIPVAADALATELMSFPYSCPGFCPCVCSQTFSADFGATTQQRPELLYLILERHHPATYVYRVQWDEGPVEQYVAVDQTIAASHAYAPGPHTIRVRADSRCGSLVLTEIPVFIP